MKFGIIGGNGVLATNRLLDMVERKITSAGAYRDAHHPEFLVAYDTQSPSRSMYLEGRGESFIPGYVETAKMLKANGCEHICMCCNTAHYAIDQISRESGASFVNLLEETAKAALCRGLSEAELWVTDGARKFDIYGATFRRIAPSCRVVYPDAERQAIVTKIICAVKTKARFLPLDHPQNPLFMLRCLLTTATAPVILGCTDLRGAYANGAALDSVCVGGRGVALDSLECLADAIVALNGRAEF